MESLQATVSAQSRQISSLLNRNRGELDGIFGGIDIDRE